MALDVSVDQVFGRQSLTFRDITGAYNASSNPGGYGAPNALFTDYAHYAIIRKKNINGVDDVVMAIDTYNPISATEFTITRDKDGWYECKKLNITIWSAGTYPSGTVRYHNTVVYKANTSTSQTPGAGAEWDVVSDLTTIEANNTVLVTTDGRTTAYDADVYWSKKIAQTTQMAMHNQDPDDRLKLRYDDIRRKVQQVLVADQQGNNTAGEWVVLALRALGAKYENW